LSHLSEAGRLFAREDLESTWSAVRDQLRNVATDLTFHLWLEPLELASRQGDSLYVKAPPHIRTLVEERYLGLIRAAASSSLGANVAVQIVPDGWAPPADSGWSERRREVGPGAKRSLDLLNPKYTFDQFVIGDGNRLAHAAALAVAELPAQAYNPLFIHGPPGVGKTHILHAIGNYMRGHAPDMVVRYATVELFTQAFVRSLKDGDVDAFKERFRGADVLLIDDVQFLADRVKTKEEFFHTFNALYETGAQLVLTSDRSPIDMAQFEARLRERFASGLVAAIDSPAVEVRLAILRKRAQIDCVAGVGDETLVEIARRVPTSVRALEGALIKVVASASLRREPATPDLARRLLTRPQSPPHANCTVAEVQAVTAAAFGLDRGLLLAHDRRPAVVFPRQVAMYLARELTDESLPGIGRAFDGRDHSTVLHAHRRIARRLETDAEVARTVDGLREQLTADRQR
jgi:chromosomal replication initiator protein